MLEAVRTGLALIGLAMFFIGLALYSLPLALTVTGALLVAASVASVWLTRK